MTLLWDWYQPQDFLTYHVKLMKLPILNKSPSVNMPFYWSIPPVLLPSIPSFFSSSHPQKMIDCDWRSQERKRGKTQNWMENLQRGRGKKKKKKKKRDQFLTPPNQPLRRKRGGEENPIFPTQKMLVRAFSNLGSIYHCRNVSLSQTKLYTEVLFGILYRVYCW